MEYISLDECRSLRKKYEQYSYTEVYVSNYYDCKRIVFGSRTSHCGGTDYGHFGLVTTRTANILAKEGVYDKRYK